MSLTVNEREIMAKQINAIVEEQKIKFALLQLEFIEELSDVDVVMNRLKKRLEEL